ncbi:hypothetical protein pipiens_017675 [Culex pipiens pipiens]|uniref:Uncharacterized protein n=1 Tax=Culex pipiens pipiens TaxID=38569 RepID=A0ABD1CFH0_CULPP
MAARSGRPGCGQQGERSTEKQLKIYGMVLDWMYSSLATSVLIWHRPSATFSFAIEVRMNGSDRRSINSKGGMKGKSTNSGTANSSVSQQLQEIYAKLQKLDDLEKLSKDLLGKLLQLAHRELRQDRLQEEALIKGVKLECPNQHLEVFRGVCGRAGFNAPDDVKEVRLQEQQTCRRSASSVAAIDCTSRKSTQQLFYRLKHKSVCCGGSVYRKVRECR